MKMRLQAVAGTFYPCDGNELEKQLEEFLSEKAKKIGEKLRAVIAPHAGYIYSGAVAGKAFALFKELNQKNEREVIVLGPSHVAGFQGASVSLAEKWQTPLGEVKTSKRAKEFVLGLIYNIEQVHFKEHCIEVELPFLQKTLKNFSIVPIVCGDVVPEVVAGELESKLNENTIIVASSDLSHYHQYEEANQLDKQTIKAILGLNIEKMERIGDACGKTPILVLMHLAKKKNWKPVLLDYKNSGDTAKDKNRVVGYASIAFVGGGMK